MGNRGSSFIELVITMVILSVLAGFSFSFMHQCVKLYMLWSREAKLQMEAAVIMDRMTRELRESMHVYRPDATNVDPADGQYRTRYLTFMTVNGTPADPPPNGKYVQYCICKPGGISVRRNMFRLNPGDWTLIDDFCCSGVGCNSNQECPFSPGGTPLSYAKYISRSVYSRLGDTNTEQGFFVQYIDGGTAKVEDDRYVLTLRLSDPSNWNSPDLVSVFFRTTICPRNQSSGTVTYADRSFNGNYSVVPPG
jgi:hypothetical protein